MVKILIADGQLLTASGLSYLLADMEGVQIVDFVHKPEDFPLLLIKHRPDLLIADYNIEDHITLEDLRGVSTLSPQTNILIISSDNERENILAALHNIGVKGYLTKECKKEELMQAIQLTSKGEKFFCQKVLNILMEVHILKEPENGKVKVLTTREKEILKLLALGNSTQKIADLLYLSPHTIHTHRKHIIRKLNIKSPTQFVIFAMDLGIIKARYTRE